MNKKHWLLALTSVVFLASPVAKAFGLDKPVTGTKLLLRDPVDVTQRKLSFLTTDQSITFGSNGDSDTPSGNGASLLIFNPSTSECQCIVLPTSGWVLGGQGKRYLYHDPAVTQSPVKLVLYKAGKVKILGRGTALSGLTLNETSQGEIAVHYTSGTGSKLCTDFTSGTVRADRPGVFLALAAPPPGACLPEPAGCTPCVPPGP